MRPLPTTVGGHIREVRLARGLLQREVAVLLGHNPSTVVHWENGTTEPQTKEMPAILGFLGYDPAPGGDDLSARMRRFREQGGLSIRQAARIAGIDPDSWSAWEKAGVIKSGAKRALVEVALSSQ